MPLLFVYGTLKRGDCRHRHMAGAKFLGQAVTSPGYRMFFLDDYPGLSEDSRGGQIEGELYEVSTALLAHLDDVEGVADECFVRRPIQLDPPGESVEAYFYLGDLTGKRELLRRWNVHRSAPP